MTNETTPRIKVWDLPTRIFHWSLALSFLGAYLTSEGERLRALHVMFGYTMLGLIVFRLVWGVVGTRHARFSSFVTGPARIKAYFGSLLRGQPEQHTGHNPAGALAVLLLLSLGIATAGLGWLTYNDIGPEWLEDAHELAANTMLAVVIVHIAGVLISSVLHRENLVRAMLSGYKRGLQSDGIGSTRRALGVVLLLAVLGFWMGYGWSNPTLLQDLSQPHQEHDDDD